jgi:hypothetical protein
MLSKSQCRGSGDQLFSTPHKKLRVKFVGKIVELEANSARRQVNLFRRAGHAGRIHDREKQLELVNIHKPAPIGAFSQRWRAGAGISNLQFAYASECIAFYTVEKRLRQYPRALIAISKILCFKATRVSRDYSFLPAPILRKDRGDC